MFSFKDLAAIIIDRARGQLERDLQARAYPDATPIPMADWLAQLEALDQAGPPPPDVPDEDDGTDPDDDGFYEDFDRRR